MRPKRQKDVQRRQYKTRPCPCRWNLTRGQNILGERLVSLESTINLLDKDP